MVRRTPKNHQSSSPRRWAVGGLIVAAVAVGLIVYLMHHAPAKQPAASAHTGNSQTKGEPAQSSKGQSPSQQPVTQNSGTNNKQDSPNPSTQLLTPTGTFVGAHHISLSSNPEVSSVCNTTPGATCQIDFTKDGTTRSLAAQTTDRGGAAYWTWQPADVGLTAGSWHVTATATLDGQSASASDATNLDVAP